MTLRKRHGFFLGMAVSILLGGLFVPSADAQKSKKPMTKAQVIELLENGVSSTRVEELIRAYGITFEATPEVVAEIRDAGASEDLVKALREIAPKPEPTAPASKTENAPASPPSGITSAAAPAPTPALPVMMIETAPPGAEVYVDEERVGKTGPEGRLKISTLGGGEHRIRVSSSGYEDFSRSVALTAGQTTVVAVTLVAVKPAVTEPPAGRQVPASSAAGSGASQPQSPLDVYKAMMGGMSGESQGDPNLKRFYVTHEHGGGGLRALGYGGGMCAGWLIIGNGRIQFSSNDEGDAFDVPAGEIADLQVKSNHVRFRTKNKKYHLMTQDMGMFGGDAQGPGALRKAFESVGLKAKE